MWVSIVSRLHRCRVSMNFIRALSKLTTSLEATLLCRNKLLVRMMLL